MKMLKKNNILVVILLLALFSGSCNSWLNIKPDSGIIREKFWKTKNDVEGAVLGCYASLMDGDVVEKMFLWGELRADFCAPGAGVPEDYGKFLKSDIQPDNYINSYEYFYRTINDCNTVLKYAKGVRALDLEFSESELKAYEAEALCIRSMMYYYLLRTFSDVPLVLEPTDNDRIDLYLVNVSQKVILRQILSDLLLAEKSINSDYGADDQNKGRFTKWSLKALQADVYLWDENYDSCILACETVINSGKFDLYQSKAPASFNSVWARSVFSDGNSTESLFEIQYHNLKTNPFFSMFSTRTGKYLLANPSIVEYFQTSDIDIDSIDVRSSASVSSDLRITKWLMKTGDGSGSKPENSWQHWVIFRYSDILLDYAEALSLRDRTGDFNIGLQVVRKLRVRRLAATGTAENPESGIDLMNFILKERVREFAYEGKRWYDIVRYSKRNNFANLSYITDVVAKTISSEKIASVTGRFSDPWYFYLPLLQYELDVNKKLKQNAYYLK